MMIIEQQLANTDLNKFKTEPLKLLIKQIYKHQKFKNSYILANINKLIYKPSTVARYISTCRTYLNFNTKDPKVTPVIYTYLDEFIQKHEGILTPSEKDKAPLPTRRCKRKQPTQETTPVEPPAPQQFGVFLNNTIKLFPNKDACNAYIQCYKEFGNSEKIELVAVDFRSAE